MVRRVVHAATGNSNARGQGDKSKRLTTQAAKAKFLEYVENGYTRDAALEKAGRVLKTYEKWRKDDPDFKAKADVAFALRKKKAGAPTEKLPFDEFRRRYLNRRTYWHQLQWVDLLEGREPRGLHPAQRYSKGKRNRLVVNTPPNHAKSTTITVDYVVYRICMDPNVMVKIISQTERKAKEFLYSVKQRLTHPDFVALQMAYAPQGGWKATADSWTATEIYIGGDGRDSGEKDPTVQALGIGGQLYGSRTDLIIMDDCITGKNAHLWESQLDWMQREVDNRPGPDGKILVIGTRLASVDLYSELLNPDNFVSGKSPWTYLTQPAILEDAEDLDQQVTVWPYSAEGGWGEDCECGLDACVNGLEVDGELVYPRWDGRHLAMLRENTKASNFALVYLQEAVAENAAFPAHAIRGSTNSQRHPGRLKADTYGHPHGGLHNRYVIASCDPAVKGYAGIVVQAVDKESGKRYVMNAWNIKAPTPQNLKDRIKQVTVDYDVDEWRIETTGLLQLFTQDEELRVFLQQHNVRFRPHHTGGNKWDPTFGVASMAPLFGEWTRATGPHGEYTSEWKQIAEPLIELPRHASEGMKALVHQLTIWTPELDPNRTPCDLVMALWFGEIGAREILAQHRGGDIRPYQRAQKFVSPRSRNNRVVVDFAEIREGIR